MLARMADMSLIGHLRHWRYSDEIARRAALYESTGGDAARVERQLVLLNAEWRRLIEVNSYARELRRTGTPDRFRDLEEFRQSVPPMSRGAAQRLSGSMRNDRLRANCQRLTGGSTAQPLRMPAWRSEYGYTSPDVWLGRCWYGLGPHCRVFFVWGHSHQMGTGVRRLVSIGTRKLADGLLGFERFPAYELSAAAMRRAAERILAFRPQCLTGYSVALDYFARLNRERTELSHAGVQTVIGAAERFPRPDSSAMLSELFQCPTAMEYGSVETSLVAHTHPEGGYRVFWATYLVEAMPREAGDPVHKILVTSLYPRFFPLLRYDLGDEVRLSPDEARCAQSLASFRRVVGRCNEEVVLTDGTRLHPEVFTHAVRPSPGILAYQVVQSPKRCALRVTSESEVPASELAAIRRRLEAAHPALALVDVVQVAHLRQTVAGKTPMVIRESA